MKRNPFLRVKIKSLAAEAKIIRADELKAVKYEDYYLQTQLRDHRLDVVRPEARLSQLAYQYLRGIPYAFVEQPKEDNKPIWSNVLPMVKKYGDHNATQDKLASWGKIPLPAEEVVRREEKAIERIKIRELVKMSIKQKELQMA